MFFYATFQPHPAERAGSFAAEKLCYAFRSELFGMRSIPVSVTLRQRLKSLISGTEGSLGAP